MLDADAAVAAAVFGLEHLISYCNHTKRCFGPTSRRRHSRGERESLHSPLLHRERDAARQRAAATRREQWTVLSGTSPIGHGLHVADSLDDRWRLRAGGREQWTVLSRTSTIGRT